MKINLDNKVAYHRGRPIGHYIGEAEFFPCFRWTGQFNPGGEWHAVVALRAGPMVLAEIKFKPVPTIENHLIIDFATDLMGLL